ncbi:peptidase C1B, bleomycin hydrolase [Cokeromyces recurvatus]|uniref:peptidase C1B, bleomycin hydrolase n=1 Tax=Cokeromyces recurvatus TaxID=90255 RepID=UPI00222110AB|nr:peptidase C1B, bleomycin hydrolase [Cokeromyces recurvatus]KAI7904643.1 peptidase C1B, bleomycin hydrolase [Cokeromyces recurvatus]
MDLTDQQVKERYASLTFKALDKFSDHFWQDKKNQLAMNALMNNDPTQVLVNPQSTIYNRHVFNVKLDLEGAATNQKQSGRCWIFAGTNVLRLAVIRKYKLNDDFELSQNFLFFYDKLEKANWFLENMIDLADEDINDRVVQYLLTSPVGDGGQWQMFINLVEKYGVVPKSVYPETVASSSSSKLNWLVTVKLREFAAQIRKAVADGLSTNSIRVIKEEMMQDIYRIMVIYLGEPPHDFNWEAVDKNGKCISLTCMTPKKFMKEVVDYPISETMSLINDPRNAYSRVYTVARLGNVVDGGEIKYVNTTINIMKKLAIDVLKSGNPVWFGCDVGQFSNRNVGSMDTRVFDYKLAFNVDFNLTKAQRLLYGESAMTHAMVFTGVHLDSDNNPVRWRVENSWSESSGEKGFWIMTDEWFSEFVYQIVLEKRVVPKKLVDLLDERPIVLPAYDPMGALACPK